MIHELGLLIKEKVPLLHPPANEYDAGGVQPIQASAGGMAEKQDYLWMVSGLIIRAIVSPVTVADMADQSDCDTDAPPPGPQSSALEPGTQSGSGSPVTFGVLNLLWRTGKLV